MSIEFVKRIGRERVLYSVSPPQTLKGAAISNVVAFHKNGCAIVMAADESGKVNPKLGDLCYHFKGLAILRNVMETLQGIKPTK